MECIILMFYINLDIYIYLMYILYKILGLFLKRCSLYILKPLCIPLFLFLFITKSKNGIMIYLSAQSLTICRV